jgi:hypothetical protein
MEPMSFDTSVNRTAHGYYDEQSSIISDLVGGGVATVTDMAASFWNSMPFTEEAETEDLLGRISNNALRVYEENPELIQTASLIGGAIVPGALALKGMNALRAGSKSVNWFTQAGKEASLREIDDMLKAGARGTAEYKKSLYSFYGREFTNEVADAAAAELAILGLYGAHPYVEDFWDNPVQNFVQNAALGGLIGGTLGHISDRFAVKALGAAVEKSAYDNVLSHLRTTTPSMTVGATLQVQEANLNSLKNILEQGKKANKLPVNDYSMQVAERQYNSILARQQELFNASLSPELREGDAALKNDLFQSIVKADSSWWLADKIRPLKVEAATQGIGVKTTYKIPQMAEPVFAKTVKKKDGTTATQEVAAVYHPEWGTFSSVKDARFFATAASLNKTPTQLAKELGPNAGFHPNIDAEFELMTLSSAEAQGKLVGTLQHFANLSDKKLGNVNIADSDIAGLTGILAKLRSDPTAYANTKVMVQKGRQDSLLAQQTNSMPANLGPDGRPQSYKQAMDGFTNPKAIEQNGLWHPGADFNPNNALGKLPGDSERLVRDWIAGSGLTTMRKAATDYFAFGFAKSDVNTKMRDAFAAIYESQNSKEWRAKFQKLADSNNQILLYRAVKVDNDQIRGQAILESYTTDPAKAAEFGKPRLYKVDVDDVVAVWGDLASSDGVSRNEVLVAAGKRPIEATLDRKGNVIEYNNPNAKIPLTPGQASLQKGTPMSIAEIEDALLAAKESAINGMFGQGVPIETIALKTNTPRETVELFKAGTATLRSLQDNFGLPVHLVRNTDQAAEAVAKKKASVVVAGNQRKNPYTAARANLDKKTLDDISETIAATVFAGSKSETARALGDLVFNTEKNSLGVLRAMLGEISNAAAGSRFFNSFDFFARNMKEVGPIVAKIGKDAEKIRNDAIKKILTPINEYMAAAAQSPAALTEVNIARAVRAGNPGYLVYRDKQFFKRVERPTPDGKMTTVEEAVDFQGKPFKVVSDEADRLLQQIQGSGVDLKELANTGRKLTGRPDVQDIGFWMPSFNPVNKFIAYLHNNADGSTQIISANSADEYKSLVQEWRKSIAESGKETELRVIEKSQQKDWSMMNGRLDTIYMQRADISKLKTGASAPAVVKPTLDMFGEIAGGYEHYINAQVRNLIDMAIPDITEQLKRMSDIAQAEVKGQTLSLTQRVLNRQEDAAQAIRNTLLGNTGLGEYEGWMSVNSSFEVGLSLASNTMAKAWNSFVAPVTKRVFNPLNRTKELDPKDIRNLDYEEYSKMLAKDGVFNPFEVFDQEAAKKFGLAKLEESKDTSKRLVYGGNALAATLALRFGEIAQPIVNMLSLPILTSLTALGKMPETFMGAKQQAGALDGMLSMPKLMYDGVRAMNSPAFKSLAEKWEKAGYFEPIVSEASAVLRQTRQFDRGAVKATEDLLDSKIVEMASRPADYSESLVRKMTMFTGYSLAKKLYPELDDAGATIFARDFLDKAVGNFHANQRPVFFQGTAGVAMGLFQTYMLTLAQGTYRALEMKNYKALGTAMLAQSGIFGASSLPGFQQISAYIGENFSDDHIDLTTGTYRAIGNDAADFVLYGLPSNLGPALHTRGDIQFRPPNVLAGLDNVVAVNFAKQGMEMMGSVASALSADNPDMGRAFMQALSMQSISRPLARGAEIATGYSTTRQGSTVSVPEEVWTPVGITARLLSTRPFEEQKLRQAMAYDSYYASIDSESRSELIGKVRTAIRNGDLTDAKLAEFAESYFENGGTARGWRTALNNAIAKTEESGKEVFINKLRPDSPLNWMISNSLE